ncbi:sugar ABC transporter substrate-binding protein [Bailinhaonella thermotolerans]|uniref:sugar ABC transporter substrate-binding protein n=1 Tax=Bailinhaonella thermotolerans TaxID=1070861 RepID=UPI00192A6AA3|nr:sugar ABC transporter substrate-binding protein [Bailinhaonella thermotolerans]
MRIAKIAAVTAALAIGLAACGGGSEGTKSGGETPKAAKPDKLTVWRFGPPDDKHNAFMAEVGAEFQQKHGVKVEVQFIPWPDTTKKLQAAATSGSGPDVTEIGNTQVVTWAAQDTLVDLTDKIAGWEEGKQIPEALWVNETIEGKKYAVPWLGGVRAVIYRKDWFKELGIEIPKTWDELLAAAKKISSAKKGVSGFEINGGSDSMHAVAPFIWGNNGQIVANEGGKWTGKLGTPEAKEALTWYTNLVLKEKVAPESGVTRNSVDISRLFANGKTAMFVDGAWAKTVLKEANKDLTDDKIGAFPLPTKTGGVAPQFAGGNDLAVWKDSKNQDLAFEYIKLLASKEKAAKYAPIAGLLPFYPDLLAGDTYKNDEWLGPFAQAMPFGRTYAVHSNWVKAEETVMQQLLTSVIKGKSVDEAAAEADKQIDQTLNQ